MRVFAKVFLTIIVLVICLIPSIGMSSIIFSEDQRFEFTMLFPYGITLLGFCSVIFHLKTVRFYRSLQRGKLLEKPNNLLLGLNLGFAASMLLLAFLFIYILFIQYPTTVLDTEISLAIIFIAIPFLLGGILFAETFYMRKKINENKEKEVLSEINNIKGDA